MSGSPRIIAMGEAIIDLIATQPLPYEKVEAFQKCFGGAPMNTAVGVARLGGSVGVVTAVGDDPFGHFIANTLEENGVDTRYVIFKREFRTTLAFVANEPKTGERSFMFYRKPWAETADSSLTYGDFPISYVKSAEILHVSGFSLSQEPSRSTIMHTIREAKGAGVKISFDPTLRFDVWNDPEETYRIYEEVMGFADIATFSIEEAESLLGTSDPSIAAERALSLGADLIGLKRGDKGSVIASRNGEYIESEAFKVKPVDTTGAGDAWNAALLVGLVENWPLKACALIANAVGALVVTARGAITAMPTQGQLRSFLSKRRLTSRLERLGVSP